MRAFVAIELSPDVREAVVELQGRLRRAAAHADVRWAEPAQLHLTLKFLGAVAEDRVAAVSRALDAALAGSPPIGVAAGGVGGFPSLARPRVLWVGITTGVPELAALAGAIDHALEPLGFLPESRPFRGHLTIGRVRSPGSDAELVAALRAAGAPDLGTWTAPEVVLYESRLRPAGALHVPVSHHALQAVGR